MEGYFIVAVEKKEGIDNEWVNAIIDSFHSNGRPYKKDKAKDMINYLIVPNGCLMASCNVNFVRLK